MPDHYYTRNPESGHKPATVGFEYRGRTYCFETDSGVFSRLKSLTVPNLFGILTDPQITKVHILLDSRYADTTQLYPRDMLSQNGTYYFALPMGKQISCRPLDPL